MSPDALFVPEPGDAVDAATGLWGLPTGWAWAPASSFSSVIGGGTPRDAADPANYDAEGTPWLTPADLSGYTRSHVQRGARSLSQQGFANSSARLLPAGTVLFSSRAPVGYCVVASNPICTNQGFKSLILQGEIVPEYIRYYMLFNRKYFVDNASGTTFKELSGSVLGELLFPIAPTSLQRRIVARIDELFAEIAEGEAALERARQGLDTWRRALLKAAVTGELTRDWREANRPAETGADLLARIRAERETSASRSGRGRRVTSPNCLETSSLPALPEGWAWTTLGDLSSLITSGSRGWKQYYAANGSVFIRAQNLKTDRLELDDVAYVELPSATEGLRTRVSRDDILVTITGANVTRSAQVDVDLAEAYVNQHVGLVRLADSRLSDFVFLVVICPSHGRKQLKAAAYGAGKPGLNLSDLASVLVPLPSLEEQRLITTRVREALSEAENALAIMERGQPQASTLRQSILKAGFEGGLAPQDPADEPASALLAGLPQGSAGVHASRGRRGRKRNHPETPELPLFAGRDGGAAADAAG